MVKLSQTRHFTPVKIIPSEVTINIMSRLRQMFAIRSRHSIVECRQRMASSRRIFCALHALIMLEMICFSQGTSKTFIKSDIVAMNLLTNHEFEAKCCY